MLKWLKKKLECIHDYETKFMDLHRGYIQQAGYETCLYYREIHTCKKCGHRLATAGRLPSEIEHVVEKENIML